MLCTIPRVALYGFTPVFAECSNLQGYALLSFKEWNGTTYTTDLVTLKAENENSNGFFNISNLPLFDALEGLPTFDQHTTPTGLVRKIKSTITDTDTQQSENIETFAIWGAYPPDRNFEDYGEDRFLSHQPRQQQIYLNQPIFLYYYVYFECEIILHFSAQYADGTTATAQTDAQSYSEGTLIAFNINDYQNLLSTDELININVWLEINEKLPATTPDTTPTRDNEIEDPDPDPDPDPIEEPDPNPPTAPALRALTSEIFYFTIRYDSPGWGNQYFLFFDKFGAIVTIPARGKKNKVQNVTRQTSARAMGRNYNRARHTTTQTTTNQTTIKTSTGWLENGEYYRSLFESEYVWLIDTENKKFIAINIQNTSFNYHKDFENIINIDFEYTFKSFNYYHPDN